jgi:hypothetical protein
MTALAMESKGTWLSWSVWAGDVQPKSRVKPAAEPKIAIRPHDRSPSTSTACPRVLIGTQNRCKLERTAFYLGNVGAMVDLMGDVSEKDIKKLQKQLKDIQKFIKDIEAMGGEVPKALKKSLKMLEVAINTGSDLGKAASEASAALKAYEKDLYSACKTVDKEMEMVCEAKIARKWQARSVQFTLNYKNPDSVTSRLIKKTVKRYTPSIICKHWDYCAKQAKKK